LAAEGGPVKSLFRAVLFALIVIQPVIAAESKPTEASIRELMSIMQSRKLFDATMKQIDAMMQASMRQVLAGQALSQKQEEILDEMRSKMVTLVNDEMNPEIFEPMLIDIYKNSFTQQEIDGMRVFYKTDAGKALIDKMPVVMQQSMETMQRRMAVFMPKLQELQRETLEKLRETQQK
jgi:hypothetical protein